MRMPVVLMCGAVALYGIRAQADVPSGAADLNVAEVVAQITGGAAGETPTKKDKPFPDFKEVTKDMESDKGMFTLWFYPPSAKDKDKEKLLCQIPASQLGQKFMLSTSFSGGGFFTGFPLDERVVKWEMLDKQLVLVEPETRFVVDKSKEVADVVRRTYPDRIRVAVPIVTKSPGGDPLIDFGGLLKSNFADIAWMSRVSFLGQSGTGGGINQSLSKWTKKKTFPQNVEIGVELAVGSPSPPGSYTRKTVHFSFWALPKSDYKPRVADDRIGYFLTTNRDWAKPTDARDIFNRYIDRWHLAKRDPSLALCEPKQPIVFYIEKTVPVRFRRAVRDGILEWNKAFEKVGFLNAVEVRQQTDDNEWNDLDPEDMRYSFFRWIVTGAGFAMGPHRANPFTGQIYDADIIFDDSMVRYFEQSAQQMLPEAALAYKTRDPALQAFLEKCPQWKRPTQDWEHFAFGDQDEEQLRQAMRQRMRRRGCDFCEYADGMKHQMALAKTALADVPQEVIDRFLYDTIKEVVTHEVGHTLGLRHNFKASTVYTVEEIKQRRATEEPTTGSVMDYNPILLFAEAATEGHFSTPTIGPYDYWAIEYGYRPYDQNYKSHKKDAEKDEEKEKESEEGAPGEEPEEEHVTEVKAPAGFDLSQIPQELLDQMPEEIKAKLAEAGAAGPAGDEVPTPKPSGAAPATPVKGEEGMLRDIASRSCEPLLAYATDYDTTSFGPDPRANRFDMGSDPIDWATTRMELVDKRMENILEWAVKDQESWYHLRQAFQTLMFERMIVLDYVGRYIGGQYFNYAHRGETESPAPFVLVEPERQRRALTFIDDQIFGDKFFKFSPELLNHLAPPRWWHEGTSVSFSMDYPIHRLVSVFQWWSLFDRLFPNTLRRIHDAEMKTNAADKFTLAEYLETLQDSCWKDATDLQRLSKKKWTNSSPYLSDVRRSLQREYLGLMEPLVRWKPGFNLSPDIHAMLKYSLRQLSEELEAVTETGKADFASQAHLVACKSRIDRMLAPELKEYSWGTW